MIDDFDDLKEIFVINDFLKIDTLSVSYLIYLVINNSITNYSDLIKLCSKYDPDITYNLISCFEVLFPLLKPWFNLVRKESIKWL